MHSLSPLLDALAKSIAQGELTPHGVAESIMRILRKEYAFIPTFAARVVQRFGIGSRPRLKRVRSFLNEAGLQKPLRKISPRVLSNLPALEPVMRPALGAAQGWSLPSLPTWSALAEWLGEDLAHLEWLADERAWETRAIAEHLRHYRRKWIMKRDGSARLLECPKPRLKAIQRRILHEILDHIPPHESAHGFRMGRSALTCAESHVGQEVVLRMDLRDFFPCVPRWRVIGIFMTAGYPEHLAVVLANLCCTNTPASVISEYPLMAAQRLDSRWWFRHVYQKAHLPQGAPTSPALANLCAYRMDCRLQGYAEMAGARYTRYADDLIFSGGATFARSVERFHIRATGIVYEEGFIPHTRKTRIMRQSHRQVAVGIVVNAKPNVSRREFDELKAILHNCVKHGPEGQNRTGVSDFRAHLAGRISYVRSLHPEHGAKLQAEFEKICWEPSD